ncbi:YciE/YciF ferroxidase family protein [Flavihumibacter profundi]|uniref:YciE/YciF ferroxidase family protein n=1 Tax=Flavihumibacter profundi TaxID=2716883 RepID=UPI001CC5D92B|nr:DUF892 family protein [Flavihumibacter profundi]MBZ5856553.1 DUF892 family protein [Flavihumibacter profundi]
MANNSSTITNLHNLLDYDAQSFIAAEVALKNSLPEWINWAGSLQLKAVLQKYLGFVEQHIVKMQDFFDEEEISTLSLKNKIMQAFIEETGEKISLCADIEVKDACLLACIQAINHFKISTYGTAAAFARALGKEKSASIFHEIEVNEKQIDDRLSQLAEFEINTKAKSPIYLP